MAAIVESVEITRPPADVFAYVTDPTHLPEWQESVVSVERVGGEPRGVGSRVKVVRRIGRMERTMTSELAASSPPSSWSVRGLDGPIRGMVKGTIAPLDNGARSRVTIELDFESHGIGKLLVPLVVRRQAQREMPKNVQHLKERLEGGA
jgi:carbon monoxide dehydrogenase subunit G